MLPFLLILYTYYLQFRYCFTFKVMGYFIQLIELPLKINLLYDNQQDHLEQMIKNQMMRMLNSPY
jgi:hypothetical protein